MRMIDGAMVLAIAGLSISHAPHPERYSYVGKKCVAASGVSVVIGGTEVGTVSDTEFTEGSGCTVIPPTGVGSSVALRCRVDNAQTAHIIASTAVALGVNLSAATWCVEVRTVAPAFVE